MGNLNKEQLKAVQVDQGPLLILAGAGSGKTRVITHRIAHLILEKKIAPVNILAVTFTNKAAEEMANRVAKLLGSKNPGVWIRTYHSTCARILRGVAGSAGIPKNFTIYDEHDQLAVVQECLKELHLDTSDLKPAVAMSAISRAKERLIEPDDAGARSDLRFHPAIRSVYRLYEKKLSEAGSLDFDDLILKAVRLFNEKPQFLQYYQNRFRHILIDEYQDTNYAQYVFTRLLAEKHRNLCVVGDDDQSIYSWRGAEIRNILEFEKDYPEAQVIKLEQNYRSTETILKAASEVIKNNVQRKKKGLWCDGELGDKIEYFEGTDDDHEAAFVGRRIIESALKSVMLNEIAVFYRLNHQSRAFEECLARKKVPYEVVGAPKFFERPEIKNVLAHLRVISNPNDTVSWKRILGLPANRIGSEVIENISKHHAAQGGSFFEVLTKSTSLPGIDGKARERLVTLVKKMEALMSLRGQVNLYELALRITPEPGAVDKSANKESEADYDRRKNIEELLISINEYVSANQDASLDDYLESVTLHSDIDEWSNKGKVSLMTLHNAKGLEFEQVFITGLEDGLLPHYKSRQEGRYEEERRLFYVGITRAKRKLFLTSAKQRVTYRGGFAISERSPFLDEIPDSVMRPV